ncbi:MAG TPA: prolyl oligopeptidase family serine peptidase [Terriglobia bacterium]|nr:prolyl oligopeptidase family serine peptidase [Terriglobia bacterium]
MPKKRLTIAFLAVILTAAALSRAADKLSVTLDEFFDSVAFHAVQIAPDGHAVVIETRRADWENNRFRKDLWLYRDGQGGTGGSAAGTRGGSPWDRFAPADAAGRLVPLTQSGYDHDPQWSPDGRWLAFLSDRPPAHPPEGPGVEDKSKKETAQLWVIPAEGGEAAALTQGDDVHAFAWSADSRRLFYATQVPESKDEEEETRHEWNDVVRFRESERGDLNSRMELEPALDRRALTAAVADDSGVIAPVAASADRVKQMAVSPDGKRLAFVTDARSQRQESLETYGVEVIDLPHAPQDGVRRVVHRQAVVDSLRWAADSKHVFFHFENGWVEGPYQDAQSRVYWADARVADAGAATGAGRAGSLVHWGAGFDGAVTDYAALPAGGLLFLGRLGTEVQLYGQTGPAGAFARRAGQPGTYEALSTATRSPRVAFVRSALGSPPEAYVADGPDSIDRARPITAFNRLLTERALPQGKTFRWTADDGVPVEGMLIYPPGRFGEKRLKMLTLIHGGPADADGNAFEADWYQWSVMAATRGWLVFEPNYRGSTGYGDRFTLGIIPHIVSRPGKDILEGVDELVKQGLADPDHLAVGGYSYGGYMTNWLITQTTRFKAAVSGAGAVEHVANWGNDDTTVDDAYFLGGLPWEAEASYNAEAAIWQFAKVRTPTHVVAGADDIRVYVGEDYLLERALYTRGIPTSLLIFPGEGHELDKNPWHGKIKVREELKWIEKYAGAGD